MIVFSPSFADGAELPFECAYDSENRSPAIQWLEAPAGTAAFALLCEDPEGIQGRGWTHWIVWNIPACETRLVAGQPAYPRLEDGSVQGINDYLELGWGGPCPPNGRRRYVFTLFALDAKIYPESATRPGFERAIDGHVLEAASIVGCRDHESIIGSYEVLRHARKAAAQPLRSA